VEGVYQKLRSAELTNGGSIIEEKKDNLHLFEQSHDIKFCTDPGAGCPTNLILVPTNWALRIQRNLK
jgi:hypothetical protein